MIRQSGWTRREVMAGGAGLLAMGMTGNLFANGGKGGKKYKIGACDWSLGKKGRLESFDVAKEIGLDGVEVSFGKPGGNLDLRKDDVRKQFLEKAKSCDMHIGSLAMGVLNGVPFAKEEQAVGWVEDAIKTAEWFHKNQEYEGREKNWQFPILLAFFGKGDIHDKPELQDEVIKRLKKVAPAAEDAGIVLGVESTMNADEHLKVVTGVDSPAVQVYYDVCNMHYNKYPIDEEIPRIGKERICQFHMKERGDLLGQGGVDFQVVKAAVEEIKYEGWLVIEGATKKGKSLVECYTENRKFLETLLPGE